MSWIKAKCGCEIEVDCYVGGYSCCDSYVEIDGAEITSTCEAHTKE